MRWGMLVAIAVSSSLAAQQPDSRSGGDGSVTIRAVVAAAWQRSAASRATEARRELADARRNAASGWMASPPSLTLVHTSDRLNRNDGMREVEAELEVPLRTPGVRAAGAATAEAEAAALEGDLASARLRIAAEVREAVWSLRLARNDLDANERRVAQTEALAADVERRVRAGDLARVDANTAHAAVLVAKAALAEVVARVRREQRLYEALTGVVRVPADTEPAPETGDLEAHPVLIAARGAADLARARLHEAGTATRDSPELILGMKRERGDFGERYANTTSVGVRLPFGSDARNRPLIGAANAELIEAETTATLQRERLNAEVEAARADVELARQAETFAAERARLAADSRQLLVKAFEFGQIDLPARLRAENDAFDAELALGRARLESGRAASRLKQAYGLLP
ncbi:outer membrane protein, cobalt-zinc-cadmium efflux system [Aromatoleum tolulyticum]|uniref:Outer membrane protein, cobalt-zinc-cadmium efflux system n=2 Tax=Aromatoleum tolulyticum TaxID=34027 RepID=A0A1N6PQG3_9RHOO|nr:outer membrane protein, cobalt-zinc-cadmium efflux system [Aromatoleum tolulyticum]